MENSRSSNISFILGKASFTDHPDYIYRACKDAPTEIFFPVETSRLAREKALEEAAALCVACPVQEACLETAIANDEKDGFFGGVDFFISQRGIARMRALRRLINK